MGRLERHLDLDLIARLRSGVKHEPKGLRQQKSPRAGSSYRGVQRNEMLRGEVRGVWRGIKPTGEHRWFDRSSWRKRTLWSKGYPRSSEREQVRRQRWFGS
jgi:hypothetical protein